MNTYIALLRGINVSGQKKIKMADLRKLLNEAGLEKLQTYIQSGNLVFGHSGAEPEALARRIEQSILEHYGFEVPTLVKTRAGFGYLLQHNPFAGDGRREEKGLYVTFLYDSPSPEQVETLKKPDLSPEEYVIDGDYIFLYFPDGYGRAKMNNNFFESKLKVNATTRNWRTVNKLYEMAGM